MTDSAALLRPTVNRVVREIVQQVGIYNPQIDVKFASKNGDSYSGEVYRVIVRPSDNDLQDEADNNNNNDVNNNVKWVEKNITIECYFLFKKVSMNFPGGQIVSLVVRIEIYI